MDFRVWKKFGFVLVLALGFGCSDATDTTGDEPLDPENGTFGIDGKADSLNGLSAAETQAILDIANSYSEEELDAFLNARAAKNIVYTRNRRGSFTTLAELDAVSYVGRAALEAFRVEAQSFDGIQVVTDPSQMVEVNEVDGRFSTEFEIVVHGQLSQDLRNQPGVENALRCNDATGSCTFRYRFQDLNDYTDRAQAGHVAVSFRSDEATDSAGFRRFARNIEQFSTGGPLECAEVENPPHCVAIYGNSCSTPIRCRVRLPDTEAETTKPARTEPIVASELVQVNESDYGLEVNVMGELADALNAQPGVSNQLICDGDDCRFRARFEAVNDYTDRAQAGHIAVSLRTDETTSDSFRRFAGNIERYSSGGPLECSKVETRCIALYGPCNQHYRCGVRLPE